MYGDRDGKPDMSTHILLYVDGKIEGTSRKSVRVVDTLLQKKSPADQKPGVTIGRNLAYRWWSQEWDAYGKYFRGGLDELIICDQAMSYAEINELMNNNRMPGDDE